jgi:hypothetical protein
LGAFIRIGSRMNTYEKTPQATAVCLAIVFAAFVFIWNLEFPSSRIVPLTERDILVYDVIPMIVAGYLIGLGAIAITRFIFPRSSIS